MKMAIANSRSALPERWLVGVACCMLAFSVSAQDQVSGTVTHLSGTFSAKRADGATKLLGLKSAVHQGDLLVTEKDTYARVKFRDGGEVVMRPNTQLRVETYVFSPLNKNDDAMVVSLLKGGMRAVTGLIGQRSKEKVEYRSVTATIGIRGTNTGMLYCNGDCQEIPTVSGQPPADGLHVDVAVGEVVITNPAGQQVVGAGQFGFAASVDTPPVIVPAGQGIQVTMPQSISANATEGRSVGGDSRDTNCVF